VNKLYDFQCRKCGHIWEQLLHEETELDGTTNSQVPDPCPECRAEDPERILGTGSGDPPISAEDYVQRHRGHLSHQVARSVRREHDRFARTNARRQAAGLRTIDYGPVAKPKSTAKAGEKAVTTRALGTGGRRKPGKV